MLFKNKFIKLFFLKGKLLMENDLKYCNSLTKYSRFRTRTIDLKTLGIGGNNPIRIQSMTTTNTMDTLATVEQAIKMYKSGSELVRITAPGIKEAENLKNIKDELNKRGYSFPLIADIHFTPNAAEAAARIVEKVRINPGNYIDKKKFKQIEYSDSEYNMEIEKIAERFTPLIKICKEYGTAMRIGTNHGSLSDRIMSRYGDTPLGMVESALEFVRICEAENYYNIVLSMKSSNPQVMVQAYRLLVNKMLAEGMNYPLHLGVTEAGDGDDARIKSAVGIGTLLEDGLGDTIRVSLTEPPENEAPVARKIVKKYYYRYGHPKIKEVKNIGNNPFTYKRRDTTTINNIGGNNSPVVIADFSKKEITLKTLAEIGFTANNNAWKKSDLTPDYIYTGDKEINITLPKTLACIADYSCWLKMSAKDTAFPLLDAEEYLALPELSAKLNFVEVDINDLTEKFISKIKNDFTTTIVLNTSNINGMIEQRRAFWELMQHNVTNPVIIKREYEIRDSEQLVIDSATDFGGLLLDGMGDGVWLKNEYAEPDKINSTLFGILQATRTRITKTEYIACPSCGRTLFDLVEVTNKIRSRTNHLKGVKIGIMGCIVNGPGEMADADYGYVGSGVGKISLYKGQKIILRNLDEDVAVEKLIDLIKSDGRWVEK
jgi:(E)-4-hydroxy-3-methylbut-2-enyl-diphosphate synthase